MRLQTGGPAILYKWPQNSHGGVSDPDRCIVQK